MPEVSEFWLSSNVPDCELEAFVVDFFDIEANCGDWVNVLVEFHLVEDSGFSSVVKTEHKDFGLHVWERSEEFCDVAAHVSLWMIEFYIKKE